jgi:hypothetical protein
MDEATHVLRCAKKICPVAESDEDAMDEATPNQPEVPRKLSHVDLGNSQQDGRDGSDEGNSDEHDSAEAPQDGLGNPNISGITPPLPANLVEPSLGKHENGIHIVTSGTEVGLFTNKYAYLCRFIIVLDNNISLGEWQPLAFIAKTHRLRYSQCGP